MLAFIEQLAKKFVADADAGDFVQQLLADDAAGVPLVTADAVDADARRAALRAAIEQLAARRA